MEDHVFRRNNLEILGGSQYKEKGFSEGGYYPKCPNIQKTPHQWEQGLILNGMAHWGEWRVLHFATKGKAIRNNI